MGILDDIEKMDDGDGLKQQLKRIEKLEEENNRLLKDILKTLKRRSGSPKRKEGERR